MSELTDLEICMRIALLEDETFYVEGEFIATMDCKEYNPLTDDSLCFQLMVKYKVDVSFHYESAEIYNDLQTKPVSFDCNGTSINRAICLAIIEAHNG